jgi:two-component system sensor histidine kinase UhpB
MLQRMSQPPLDRQGLRSAVADLVTAWQIEARDGSRLVLEADAGTEGLRNDESALCAYRIVQECLSNIARHAPLCKTARVGIRRESHTLHVRVSNDLEGARPTPGPGVGMGLRLLNERVHSLGGFFSIDVSATEFAVRASLPVKAP